MRTVRINCNNFMLAENLPGTFIQPLLPLRQECPWKRVYFARIVVPGHVSVLIETNNGLPRFINADHAVLERAGDSDVTCGCE